ncbi:MAG TPA: protein kinase [Caldilineaceae bacterium]|nr:protein kinase [Caldilineaceae bacterium]
MTNVVEHSTDIPQQVGPYRIDTEIARTRSLIIYRAHDTLYERPVLLKVLQPAVAQQAELVRRFISLGREAARLDHPHLAAVYEAGHADGLNYIVQELVGGPSLATRLQNRQHPYLIYDAITIIEQLAAALDYAHQHGFTHGALTADSIFFTADNQPKIIDVGLLALESLGESGVYVANVSPFMAPEQARGETGSDRQADIYTLGVIAFLLLTGQTPFTANNPLALLRKIIDEEPPVDEMVVGAIPAHVSNTLRRALAKYATERHASATEFAHALLRGEPTPVAFTTTAGQDPRTVAEESGVPATGETDGWAAHTIEIEPEHIAWQSAAAKATQRFVPFEERATTVVHGPSQAVETEPPQNKRQRRRPLFTVSLLGAVALLLTLITTGRVIWNLFGEQMIDAAMTPYAAAQASRLTPPLPPTMLTGADTPFFGNGIARTRTLLGTEPPVIVAMSSVSGGSHTAGVADLTGSPPMVVIAPSRTPTDASTDTPAPTKTPLPTATVEPTATPLPTDTPVPTETPTATATATAVPTETATPTATLEPTVTATSSTTPTATVEPTATPSPTPSATATETVIPTSTDVPEVLNLGGRIAYTVWDHRTDRYSLIFYSIAKGESWPIVPNRRQPDFAPNGQLVASGDGGYIDNLVLMGTNGENPVPISAHSEDAHPHWSPSGKAVVFDSTLVGDGRHRLYLQTAETFGQPLGPMMFEAWELFGRYPIFLSNGQIAYNGCDVWENAVHCGIYQVDTQGSRPQGVTQWPGDIPTDNLGNQILATSDRDGDWDIYRIDSVTGAAEQLTDSPGRDGLATASPDGNYIAFVSDREGVWAVYVMAVDGSNEQKLFELDGGFGSGDRDWLQERLSWGW